VRAVTTQRPSRDIIDDIVWIVLLISNTTRCDLYMFACERCCDMYEHMIP